jgi:hypothetical protein
VNEDIILGGLSILFTGMVVLVPVLGLTIRFAIKPFFDSWVEIQRGRVAMEEDRLLARQVSLMEGELQEVQRTLQTLVEGQDFQRQLAAPEAVSSSRADASFSNP